MGDITDNIKKIGAGLGIFTLPYAPLIAQESLPQEKQLAVKVGLAYSIVQRNEFSKNAFGIETLLEDKLKERLSAEWEIGMYSDTRTTNSAIYSKMQTNVGLKYKPFVKNGFSMGGKAALGLSGEFYKEVESAAPYEKVSLNKLIALDAEKVFESGAGFNLSLSREIDRKIWKITLKRILKPESKIQRRSPIRKHFPWPSF